MGSEMCIRDSSSAIISIISSVRAAARYQSGPTADTGAHATGSPCEHEPVISGSSCPDASDSTWGMSPNCARSDSGLETRRVMRAEAASGRRMPPAKRENAGAKAATPVAMITTRLALLSIALRTGENAQSRGRLTSASAPRSRPCLSAVTRDAGKATSTADAQEHIGARTRFHGRICGLLSVRSVSYTHLTLPTTPYV